MKKSAAHHKVGHLIETIIDDRKKHETGTRGIYKLAQELAVYDCRDVRVVVLGGGTGLSTVVGGNPQLPDWPDSPFNGLKEIFPHLHVIVCTTDDGRSTGRLLKQLPIIGVGDLRKLCVALILLKNLQKTYRITEQHAGDLVRLIHTVFNYRFDDTNNDFRCVANPLLTAPAKLRRQCPAALKELLCSLGTFLTPRGRGPTIQPGGHALGNLLLTAAILSKAKGTVERPPGLGDLRAGLDLVAQAIGVTPGRLHPATAAPGQLVFRYANGVEVCGQHKATVANRRFPVERLRTEYYKKPVVSRRVLQAIRDADLIILAPGSLYTSSIPILQLQPVAQAIRSNRRALKILGANFWVQEGETDIAYRAENRGFRVSELIDAYDRNVTGGYKGLFHVVLSTNLAQIPGSILRKYALEGKRPIYLDRQRIKSLGLRSFEAVMFSMKRLRQAGIIHHDPEKFAMAVRTLLYARKRLGFMQKNAVGHSTSQTALPDCPQRSVLLCNYYKSITEELAAKQFRPKALCGVLKDLVWENRDIRVEHLRAFRGAQVISGRKWNRNTEWDNVLGYYDPHDRLLKVHEQVVTDSERLRENLLIALGESLLGRYRKSFRWIGPESLNTWGLHSFEIRLRPEHARECFLSPAQLHDFLRLARLVRHPQDPLVYKVTLNSDEGFLTPGLLFGLMYAWYLNNSYCKIMEHEMSPLQWQPNTLIPHHVQARSRRQALITFFRTVVFGYSC